MKSSLTDLDTLREIIEIHFNQLEANKNEEIIKNEELRVLEEQRAKIEEQLQIVGPSYDDADINSAQIE